jgi:hypothetical protein
MRRTIVGLAICFTSIVISASAQTVTGSGTTGNVPAFTGSSTLGNSVITQSGTNVGFGTTTPGAPLEIDASSSPIEGGRNALYLDMSGSSGNRSSAVVYGYGGGRKAWEIGNDLPASGDQDLYIFDDAASATRLYINSTGNVGIGTTSPGATLEVDGSMKLTSGSGASITFADGTTQSTAYTGVTCGGDYAEAVDIAGVRASYEPGDVLVIGPDSGSDVVKSSKPYSTLVTGVYSTKPGVVGRRQMTDLKASKTEVPMAMIGIVPTKVSAENGPIRRGDLLVTSSIPGYAMKGTDHSRMLGAVIGKALGNLDSGTGVIEAVITLQ